MSETKLTEQEVLLLEAYRRLEDKGRMEVWHTVMRAEEMQTVTKLLGEMEATVDVLRSMFMTKKNVFKSVRKDDDHGTEDIAGSEERRFGFSDSQ